MSELTQKARKALESFSRMKQPMTFADTGPGEAHNLPGAVTGSLRAADGRAVIVPVNESSSMLAAFPFVFEFILAAPGLIEELTGALERVEEEKVQTADNRPPKPPAPPKDREMG